MKDTDIVCAEGELSMAANQITRHAEFLVSTIGEYRTILADIQENGIRDEAICSKLAGISMRLVWDRYTLEAETKDVSGKVRKHIRRMEEIDCFQFPGGLMDHLKWLIDRFKVM